MDVRFVAPDLRKLDGLDVEVFASCFHEDERPLRGAAGLLDWRLCGRLSQLVRQNKILGTMGEIVLLPTMGRASFERILMVGAGPSASADAACAMRTLSLLFEALDGLKIRRVALALPGRLTGTLEAEPMMELLTTFILEPHEQDTLTIVDHADEHRGMQRVLDAARRRARVAS